VNAAWLKIARAPGLRSQRLLELLPTTGGIDGFLALPAGALRKAGFNEAQIAALKAPDPAQLDADRAWLEGSRRRLLTITDPEYPALLRASPSPPAVLWLEGDSSALWQPQIAVVGSRNPTAGGRDHARDFAGELSRAGWTITSGLAAGIDVTAHRAALDAGGQTVAVLGTGLDIIYPRSNQAVAAAISERGVLVSELPPGTPPRKQHFPDRNRIIAGLSLGVLVVEAALNSGSLITARLAAEQGREVFALPGSLHNPMVKGCHRLIKQGARLAESTGDITAALEPVARELALALTQQLQEPEGKESKDSRREHQSEPDLLEDKDYARLWDAIAHDPLSQDQLVERTGMSAREVSSMLLMLELRGFVTRESGGRIARSPRSGAAP
jgi:DNA processing protein